MFDLIPTAWAADVPGIVPVEPSRCDQLAADPSLWSTITLKDLECIFNRVYNYALLSVGAVFLIWMIISGIRYITASGDEKATAAARRSLTFAILGFILVIAAYATIQILTSLAGWNLPVPPFTIPAASP
jgi:hypothetical protein